MTSEIDPKNMNRRTFLGVAGATVAVGATLAACNKEPEKTAAPNAPDAKLPAKAPEAPAVATTKKPYEGQTLRVFIYSGAWEKTMRETFVPKFQEKTGATVVLDPGWWDSIPKLKASPPGQPAFDLVLTDATQGYPAIKEGMFQKIDMTRIPNKTKLAQSVLKNWVHDDGYGIPFPDSAMTLAWNKKLVKTAPTGWADLMNNDVKGKLGVYNSFYMSLYTFAAMKVGLEKKEGTAYQECMTNLPGVVAFAKENRARVKYWWPTSSDMAVNLGQQNCAMGNMHSSDMLPALKSNQDLAAIVPDKDRAFVLLMWVVPTGTKVKPLAEDAIDYLLGEEMQEAFAKNGSTSAVLSVAKKMAAADPVWGAIYPSTEAQMASVQYYPYEAYFKDWDGIVATWDKEILRKKA